MSRSDCTKRRQQHKHKTESAVRNINIKCQQTLSRKFTLALDSMSHMHLTETNYTVKPFEFAFTW